jgi:hypothetical protein
LWPSSQHSGNIFLTFLHDIVIMVRLLIEGNRTADVPIVCSATMKLLVKDARVAIPAEFAEKRT